MSKRCFFCDIQENKSEIFIAENDEFFARFDKFPVSRGHAEIVPKKHLASFFELSPEQVLSLYSLIKEAKELITAKFKPDGFNIGINEGTAAGQSLMHLHVHLIPRYAGDVKNPSGGVRNVLPGRGDYWREVKDVKLKDLYLNE